MSETPIDATPPSGERTQAPARWPVAQYAAALALVAVATVLAAGVEHLAGAPNLTLIYVLPVIATATWFGWGPSLAATAASVLAFDFFFTAPRYSLEIDSPSDIWAAGLLLVIAAVVSAVAAQSRRRAHGSEQAAEQAGALQALAHVVIHSGSQDEILAAAASALNRIFRAPAAIFVKRGAELRLAACAGGATITTAEEEAARGTLDSGVQSRAETYPFTGSAFDFWPVAARGHGACVVGVSFLAAGRPRPAEAERFIEIVGAYLAIALERPASAG